LLGHYAIVSQNPAHFQITFASKSTTVLGFTPTPRRRILSISHGWAGVLATPSSAQTYVTTWGPNSLAAWAAKRHCEPKKSQLLKQQLFGYGINNFER
jgi:hypothetical protein